MNPIIFVALPLLLWPLSGLSARLIRGDDQDEAMGPGRRRDDVMSAAVPPPSRPVRPWRVAFVLVLALAVLGAIAGLAFSTTGRFGLADLTMELNAQRQVMVVALILGAAAVIMRRAATGHRRPVSAALGVVLTAVLTAVLSGDSAVLYDWTVPLTALCVAGLATSHFLREPPAHPGDVPVGLRYAGLYVLGLVPIAAAVTVRTHAGSHALPAAEALTQALLLVGLGAWLATGPIFAWLADLAAINDAAVAVQGLLVGPAIAYVWLELVSANPWLLTDVAGRGKLFWLGAVTALIFTVLAYAEQRRLRRLAYVMASEHGLWLCGLSWLAISGHGGQLPSAVLVALLVSLIAGRALIWLAVELGTPGWITREPGQRLRILEFSGLVAGMLLVMGIPPLGSWWPRLWFLRAAAGSGGVVAVALVIAILGLQLVAYLRPAAPAPDRPGVVARPPVFALTLAGILIVACTLAGVAVGLWPVSWSSVLGLHWG